MIKISGILNFADIFDCQLELLARKTKIETKAKIIPASLNRLRAEIAVRKRNKFSFEDLYVAKIKLYPKVIPKIGSAYIVCNELK